MPITKQPKKNEPLWREWDYKAQKKGVHHTVYSVNGDRYTGEWDNNQKNGESLARGRFCIRTFGIKLTSSVKYYRHLILFQSPSNPALPGTCLQKF